MTAPRILRRNIADEATFDAESPLLLSTLPVSNLQTQPRNEVARTSGARRAVHRR
jgi:hypothetical protein